VQSAAFLSPQQFASQQCTNVSTARDPKTHFIYSNTSSGMNLKKSHFAQQHRPVLRVRVFNVPSVQKCKLTCCLYECELWVLKTGEKQALSMRKKNVEDMI
jgi:hypothetical protein